jgi:hypothetical protein
VIYADAHAIDEALKDVNLVRGELITGESGGDDLRNYLETVVKVDSAHMIEYIIERWMNCYHGVYTDPMTAYMTGHIEGLAVGRKL